MVGCKNLLIYLVKLPLCMGLLYVLLSLRQPFPTIAFGAEGAGIMAAIAGFFLWGGIFYYLPGYRRLQAEREMLLAGGPFREGQRAVVNGIVEAEGPLLTAPVSGRPCLGYLYYSSRFSRSHGASGTGAVEIKDYEGYGLTPTVIRSASGTMRILAKPEADFFKELPVDNVGTSKENRERAASYFLSTDYGELKGLKQVYHHEVVDGPGAFRYDKKPVEPPEESYSLYEVLLHPGQQGILAGVYNADLGGIAPDPDWITHTFCLKPGEPADLGKEIRAMRFKAKLWVALAVIAVAVYYLLVMPSRGPQVMEKISSRAGPAPIAVGQLYFNSSHQENGYGSDKADAKMVQGDEGNDVLRGSHSWLAGACGGRPATGAG